jgi:hypothetical protein
MLTINADMHPLFMHMHRPDRTRPPEQQDKRMVVVLPEVQYEEWFDAPVERSMAFMNQYPAERMAMAPEPAPPKDANPKSPQQSSVPPEEPSLF